MSYPQQPQNDPQQYQQPGYPQPPAPSPGTPQMNVDFAALGTPENRAYLIAGIGGLVAFLGYFILPYYTFSISGITIGNVTTPGSSTSVTGSQYGSWLLLSLFGGIVALVVAALMALGIRAVPQLTPQLASRILLGSGAASVLGLLIFFFKFPGGGGTGYSYGTGFGFWIAALATIAMLVGGVMQMQRTQ